MTAPATKLLPRGVWVADYLLGGCRVLLAIDSRGECLRRVKLSDLTDEDMAREWLEGSLDHYDPLPVRPTLTIVPPSKPPRVPTAAFVVMNRAHARRR